MTSSLSSSAPVATAKDDFTQSVLLNNLNSVQMMLYVDTDNNKGILLIGDGGIQRFGARFMTMSALEVYAENNTKLSKNLKALALADAATLPVYRKAATVVAVNDDVQSEGAFAIPAPHTHSTPKLARKGNEVGVYFSSRDLAKYYFSNQFFSDTQIKKIHDKYKQNLEKGLEQPNDRIERAVEKIQEAELRNYQGVGIVTLDADNHIMNAPNIAMLAMPAVAKSAPKPKFI